MNTSICHHGIKGQKWGQRNGPPYPLRIAYKDGSLTKYGRKRVHEYLPNEELDWQKTRKSSRVSKLYKGTSIYRVSNEEPLDDQYKYVSFNKDDNDVYKKYYDTLYADVDKSVWQYKMRAIKDIKIADYDTVLNDAIDKYGDKKLKDVINDADFIFNRTNNQGRGWVYPKNKEYSDVKDFLKSFKWYTANNNAIISVFEDHMDDIRDDYLKKGYDAIADVLDQSAAWQQPIVLLNPKDSVKVVGKKRLN